MAWGSIIPSPFLPSYLKNSNDGSWDRYSSRTKSHLWVWSSALSQEHGQASRHRDPQEKFGAVKKKGWQSRGVHSLWMRFHHPQVPHQTPPTLCRTYSAAWRTLATSEMRSCWVQVRWRLFVNLLGTAFIEQETPAKYWAIQQLCLLTTKEKISFCWLPRWSSKLLHLYWRSQFTNPSANRVQQPTSATYRMYCHFQSQPHQDQQRAIFNWQRSSSWTLSGVPWRTCWLLNRQFS